jgi:hypothetical protein
VNDLFRVRGSMQFRSSLERARKKCGPKHEDMPPLDQPRAGPEFVPICALETQ